MPGRETTAADVDRADDRTTRVVPEHDHQRDRAHHQKQRPADDEAPADARGDGADEEGHAESQKGQREGPGRQGGSETAPEVRADGDRTDRERKRHHDEPTRVRARGAHVERAAGGTARAAQTHDRRGDEQQQREAEREQDPRERRSAHPHRSSARHGVQPCVPRRRRAAARGRRPGLRRPAGCRGSAPSRGPSARSARRPDSSSGARHPDPRPEAPGTAGCARRPR